MHPAMKASGRCMWQSKHRPADVTATLCMPDFKQGAAYEAVSVLCKQLSVPYRDEVVGSCVKNIRLDMLHQEHIQ